MTSSTNSTRRTHRTSPFARALTCAESTPPGYRPGPPQPPLRVDDPGTLIAALPAMLGFVPERSLVAAVLRGTGAPGPTAIEAVVRFDLDSITDPWRRDRFTACLGSICLREQAVGVLVVIVDDRMADGADVLCAATLIEALGTEGVAVRGAWSVPTIAAGSRYRNLSDPRDSGIVGDPGASPVAVAQVVDGRQIRRSRGELTALVRADRQRCARVRTRIGPAVARYRAGLTAAARAGQTVAFQRNALEWVLWQIADAASGEPRADRELARLAATLRDRPIRDAMYGLALTDHAEAAEQLWAQLARATPGVDRAEAAALLGFSAYLRGDGPFAGVALSAAVHADATHPMAVLLETSLQSGLRPERLRRLARCGHQIAADLGVDIGPIDL